MDNFGFIGMGNMGSAMLKGAVDSIGPEHIGFYDHIREFHTNLAKETGVTIYNSNIDCVKNSKYIILSIKPDVYPIVIDEIRGFVTEDKVIISIAPTYTIQQVKDMFDSNRNVRIIRAMPNTPALVGEGMTGISYDEALFNEEEVDIINNFFSSFGKCKTVPENLMNAVVCGSGSSPAYVYIFIEALADSIVKYGMKRDDAYIFAAQTVLGSAKMVLESGEHPAKLKDNVCSPGGTTIRAVEQLEANGFRKSIFKATESCYSKCKGKE